MLSRLKNLYKIISGPTARSTTHTSCVFGLRLIIQAGSLVLLTRMLGSQQFGFFAAVASTALLFGTAATMGLHLTLLRDLARSPAKRHELLRKSLGTTVLSGIFLLFLYLASCLLLFKPPLAGFLVIILVGTSETLIQPLLLISIQERIAAGKSAHSQIYMALPLFLRLIWAGSLYYAEAAEPLLLYSIGYFATSIIALAISLEKLKEKWPKLREWKLIDSDEAKKLKGFALLGFTNRANSEVDKVIASQWLTSGAAGHYAAASRVLGALITPINALIQSVLPKLFSGNHYDERKQLHLWILFISFSYGCASAWAMYFLSPFIANLFGPDYPELTDYMRYIALATPALALRLTGCNILMSIDCAHLRTLTEISSLFVLLLAGYTLTAKMPTAGLPLAYMLAELWGGVISWVMVFKYNRPSHHPE